MATDEVVVVVPDPKEREAHQGGLSKPEAALPVGREVIVEPLLLLFGG